VIPSPARGGIVGWLRALSEGAIRRPAFTLTTLLLLTLCAAPGIRRLKLRTDGAALISPSAPEVLYDQAIRRQFGIEDQFVVLVRSDHADGVFDPGTLQLVRDLTAECRRLSGINPNSVISLATEASFRYRPGTYQIQRLLEPALTNRVELDQLRDDLRRIELYTGTLVSSDGKSTLILIGIPPGADRSRLYKDVMDVVAHHKAPGAEVAVTGAPVAELLLGDQILQDLGVPRALLSAGTRCLAAGSEVSRPTNLGRLLRLVRRLGLVPVAAFVMVLVLLICFRNVVAALLPLPGVAAVLLFVFGLMGWCRTPVYLTIAVMPVLLTAISATNDIYLLSRYLALLRQRPEADHVQLLRQAFDKLVGPVACTSLTAVMGFLSFGLSPLVPVRAFGILTGVGALYGLFFSLTAVPALLALTPARWLRRRQAVSFRLSAAFAGWAAWVGRRRWWVAAAVLLLMATLMPSGLRQLVVQDSWMNGFDPDSDFRRVTRQVNLLYVSVDAPRRLTGQVAATNVIPGTLLLPASLVPDRGLIDGSVLALSLAGEMQPASLGQQAGDTWRARIYAAWPAGDRLYARIAPLDSFSGFWEAARRAGRVRYEIPLQSQLSPDIVRCLADLSSFIRGKREDMVGGVLGPAEYLMTTRFMGRSFDARSRRLADTSVENKKLWNDYAIALGVQRRDQVIDTNYWQSLTTVFLKDGNFVDTARLMRDIRGYEREHLTPKGIKLGFAGDVAVSQSLISGIVTTQLESLLWAMGGIFVVTAWFGRSLRWGIYCLLPSALAVLIKFAAMGAMGIPLGVATSMFAAMTLGIGVNCAIHLLESYRLARTEGAKPSDALGQAMGLTGPPALINTLAMSLGFGVLMLSQVPANARLGLLLVLGLVNCLAMSLLLLPVLLHWWPPNGAVRAGSPPGADSGVAGR
jgi:hypothetical protein